MSRLVKFTVSFDGWIFDISDDLEDPESEHHSEALKLVELIKRERRSRSEKKRQEITKEIFELLDVRLTADVEPGDLFDRDLKEGLDFPITVDNSTISVKVDDDSYEVYGDVFFEFVANKDLTPEIMEAWELTGYLQPNLYFKFGDFSAGGDGGLSWEILED